jgi:hypothetical protein
VGKTLKVIGGIVLIAATFVAPVAGLAALAIGNFAVGGVLLGAARLVGLSLINSALAPSPDVKQRAQQIRQQRADPQAFVPVVYGEINMSPRIVNMALGNDPYDLYFVGALCMGSRDGNGIEALQDLKMELGTHGTIDVTTAPVTTTTDVGGIPISTVKGVSVYTELGWWDGADAQAASTYLVSNVSSGAPWTADHKLGGVSYFAAELQQSRQSEADNAAQGIYNTGGLPRFIATVRGARCYDPRDTLWKWTQNPALALYDYLLSDKYGAGLTAADLDTQSFIDAANFCDATVNTHTRFTINGWLDPQDGIENNIRLILSAMRGTLLLEGGLYKLHINDADAVSGVKVGEDDLVGSISVSLPSGSSAPNQIVARFINSSNGYEAEDVQWPAPGAANTMLTDDNNRESRIEIDLPMTTDRRIAEEIAMVTAREMRSATTVAFACRQAVLEASVGDIIELTSDDMGWTDQPIRIWAIEPRADGIVAVSGVTHNSVSYSLDPNATVPTTPGTDLPDPSTVVAPTLLTLTSNETTLLVDDLGNAIQYITADWTGSEDIFLEREEVFYKKNTDTEYQLAGTRYPIQFSTLRAQQLSGIGPVEIGVLYDVKVEAVNTLGVRSTPLVAQVTPTTGTDTPGDPSALTIDYNAVNGVISLTWDFLTGTDGRLVRFYDIRYGATWATATSLGYAFANVHSFLASMLGSRSETIWVGAISRFGTESVTPISAAWSDPAPNAAAVTAPDVSLSSRQGQILLTVDTTSVDATEMFVYGSLSTGFTPGDANRLAGPVGVTNGPGTVASFALPAGWSGNTFYIRLGFKDFLTDPLLESEQLTGEFSSTGADSETEVAPAVDGLDLELDSGGGVIAHWTGNESVNSVRIASSKTDFPTEATTRAAGSLAGRSGTSGTLQTITVGETCFVTIFGYTDGVGGGTESELGKGSIVRSANTTAEIGAQREVTFSATAPGSPQTGDMWVETDQSPPVIYYWNGSGWNDIGLLGQGALALLDTVDTAQIAADAIKAAQIAADAVDSTHLAVNAVYTNAVQTDAITNVKVADNAIDTPQLNAGAITTAKIGANQVTAAKIAALTITAAEIAAGTITGAKIAATTITGGNIAATTIQAGNIASNTITGTQIAAIQLSAINADVGLLTAGLLQNGAGTRYIDLDATGNQPFIKADNLEIQADGDAIFSGELQGAPVVIKGGGSTGSLYIYDSDESHYARINNAGVTYIRASDSASCASYGFVGVPGGANSLQIQMNAGRIFFNLSDVDTGYNGDFDVTAPGQVDFNIDQDILFSIDDDNNATAETFSVYAHGNSIRFQVQEDGDILLGSTVTTTSRTTNFTWLQAQAGPPTGSVSSIGSRRAMCYDYTNNRLYVRNSTWKYVNLI